MKLSDEAEKTDFGFQEVPLQEKAKRVANVFRSVAKKYDLMNDVMSFGLHRLWKQYVIVHSGIRSGQTILDVAGGTGDLTIEFLRKLNGKGQVVLSDINEAMLMQGRDKLIEKNWVTNVSFLQADAENLPFKSNYFDCVSMAFGLRNVTSKRAALHEIYRILKPGGRMLILEFSKPILPVLQKLYDLYSFNVIPTLGSWICGDSDSYQYLVESIRRHPNQQILKNMIEESGFEDVEFYNLTGGIVALHKGFKY